MTIVNVKRLIDTLVEKCSEDINGNEIVYNATLNDHGGVWKSCTICIVLLIITPKKVSALAVQAFILIGIW